MATIHPTKYYCTVSYSQKYYYIIAIYNNNNNSAGMKERCRDGCRTSLLIAGVVFVPAIFHTLLPPCHPYITIHFMEMIFSTCNNTTYTIITYNIYILHCFCTCRKVRLLSSLPVRKDMEQLLNYYFNIMLMSASVLR